ncbi:MAG TPA: phosphotransferase family protein [Casimicrobiaceae bacterium]|nr:phosphotransferase family protein [Casimicrobiaceae bacterium]
MQEALRARSVDTPEATALARWLAREMHAQDVRVVRYERLPGGAIQDNHRLDVDVTGGPHEGAAALVLRADAPSAVAASLTRAQEFAVLRVAHANGVAAPKPLFLCRDRSVVGRAFFVMERLPGIAAGHRLTREPDLVPDPDALAHALGANLARLHAIGPRVAGLDVLSPASDDPARNAIGEYRAYLDRLEDAYPALECGLRWCDVHAPKARAVTLVHRDYRTGNYLVDGGRLSGVLDWEFAGLGDPREDLGWFTARCWRFAAPEREAGGIAALEPFLDGYESVAGWRIARADLDYWQLMAHLRWAIIALQQARRHRAGGERSLELALTGRIVHELEYEALHIVARSRA